MAKTTARHSFWMALQLHFDILRARLAYAMTLLSCSRTAPNPMAMASVCKTKRLALAVNQGYPKIGACMSLHFIMVNAAFFCPHEESIF